MREKTRTYRLLVVIKGMNSYAARHEKARLKNKERLSSEMYEKGETKRFKFKNAERNRLSAIISIPLFVLPRIPIKSQRKHKPTTQNIEKQHLPKIESNNLFRKG